MRLHVLPSKEEMARAAAKRAAQGLNAAIAERGTANLVLATGASQFEMLATLVTLPVAWRQVTAFHLDEYIGLPVEHPASFRRYLSERFAARLPHLGAFYFIDGNAPDPAAECQRLGEVLADYPIDVACIGIGENGHIAFNDPPADFETQQPYLVVELDEACRRQQLGEGWFACLADVPPRAITMSVRQILRSRSIVCTVPDLRKAAAVRAAAKGPVTGQVPASILQQHPDCDLFLDPAAASLLD
jgi:glucosamine-6-phosphate deaminase